MAPEQNALLLLFEVLLRRGNLLGLLLRLVSKRQASCSDPKPAVACVPRHLTTVFGGTRVGLGMLDHLVEESFILFFHHRILNLTLSNAVLYDLVSVDAQSEHFRAALSRLQRHLRRQMQLLYTLAEVALSEVSVFGRRNSVEGFQLSVTQIPLARESRAHDLGSLGRLIRGNVFGFTVPRHFTIASIEVACSLGPDTDVGTRSRPLNRLRASLGLVRCNSWTHRSAEQHVFKCHDGCRCLILEGAEVSSLA